MTDATHRLVHIAVADDDVVDRRTVRRALQKAGLANQVTEVNDGEQLLALMQQRAPFQDAPRPDLVLLDLNMPNLDGRAVLAKIADDPDIAHIPVVVLTVSELTEDIRKSYLHGAISFITKPVTFDELRRVIDALDGYSMAVVHQA